MESMNTVDDWFASSDESDQEQIGPKTIEDTRKSRASSIRLSLRRSFPQDDASVRKSMQLLADGNSVDSPQDFEDRKNFIIRSPVPLRKSFTAKISDLAKTLLSDDEQLYSPRSNKENDFIPRRRASSLPRRPSVGILDDITPAEESEEEVALGAVDDVFEAPRQPEEELELTDTIVHSLEEEKDVVEPNLPRRISISFKKDSTPPSKRKKSVSLTEEEHEEEEELMHDNYEAPVQEDYNLEYETTSDHNQIAIHEEELKSKEKKARKPKSILKVNKSFEQDEYLGDIPMPKELAKPSMGVKIFEKGGLKQVETDEGVVKRSSRMKYPPLEYWRNERVKFGRRKSGLFPVPVIQEIIRVPEEEEAKKRKRKRKSKRNAENIDSITFMNIKTGEQDQHDLMVPGGKELNFKQTGGDYKIAKLLDDPFDENLFTGMMFLPRGTEKPLKNNGDVTIFGFVHSGEVKVRIHETSNIITKGGSFVIPRGNNYSFTNVGSRDAEVFIVNDKRSSE